MTNHTSQVVVDLDKCIGCWACAHVCQAGLITFADDGRQRTLRFVRICGEDCTRCAEVCPEEAITLTPATETALAGEYLTATFDLLRCRRCDAPFTTERIINKLLAVIPQEFQNDAAELSWVRLCPDCRRVTEGEKVAQEWIMSRWPGDGLA